MQPGLPGFAAVTGVGNHAERAHYKTFIAVLEHHIQPWKAGPLTKVHGYFITQASRFFWCQSVVLLIEMAEGFFGETAVQLSFPGFPAVRTMQDQTVMSGDPGIGVIEKIDTGEIRTDRR